MKHEIEAVIFRSPAGKLVIGDYCGKICLCDWAQHDDMPRKAILSRLLRLLPGCCGIRINPLPATPLLQEAVSQIEDYFDGKLSTFDLPICPVGTPFQLTIWERIRQVGYGKTASYSDLIIPDPESGGMAESNPMLARAAANATAANAMSILIPCHRICRKGGIPHTGYAGGLEAKRLLLELESCSRHHDIRP